MIHAAGAAAALLLLAAASWGLGWLLAGRARPEGVRLAGAIAAPLLIGAPDLLARLAGAGPAAAALVSVGCVAAVATGAVRMRARAAAPSTSGSLGPAVPVAIVAAAVVGATFLANPLLALHSDAWFHAAVAMRVHDLGIPPLDPYYAGLRLLYFWFFHVYVDALATVTGLSPSAVMAVTDVWAIALFTLAIADAARAVGGGRREVRWAAVLGLVGVNVVGWVWFLAQAAVGTTRGIGQITAPLGSGMGMIGALGWRYTGSLGFWADKFFVGTAFSAALPASVVLAPLAARALRGETGSRRAALAAGILALDLAALHTVLALATVASLGVALVVAVSRAPRATRARTARAAVWIAGGAGAGLAAASAYLYCLLSGKERQPIGSLALDIPNLWTALAAGLVLWALIALGARVLRARARGADPGVIATLAWPLGALLLAAAAPLPGPNENKFLYPVLAIAAALAAPGAVRAWDAIASRFGRGGAVLVAVLVFAPTPALALAAELLDAGAYAPASLAPTTSEREAYAWLARHAPRDAVVLDAGGRVDVIVRARRDVLWGGETYAEQWGYPRAEIAWRRRVADDAFAGGLTAADLAALARLRRPVYALARAGGPPAGPAAALEPLWANADVAIARVRTEAGPRPVLDARADTTGGR